ncbi:MAG: polysaccharide deacetylase family protein [Chloroflexi bacterium]|nr:polysaccharide deacetylase family protein [Chloroflexota bacterium]
MNQTNQTNRLLGYPDDARLLLVNADDFGMYHAINEAILRTMREGIVRSTSLMMPCPLALHAIELLKASPDIHFGVHLTVICDLPHYRWRPLTSKEKVPSLIVETGYFFSMERMSDLLAQADLSELETEFRAQIETVLATGLKPTHLDWHCLHSGGRPDIFDLTFGLAREYDLALRVDDQSLVKNFQQQGLPTPEYNLLDSFGLDITEKSSRYAQLLSDLPVGLSEWAVHPGLGNMESKAIDPDGWQVRQTDYDFLMSSEAREIIEEEGIITVSYEPLQNVWQGR